MKLFLAGIAGVMLLLAIACKKDAGSNYYLKADLNGVNENFNANAFAQEFSGDFTASFSVHGINTSLKHQLSVNIGHVFGRIITPGTYDKTRVDSFYLPALAYTINDTIVYGSGVRPENPYPVSITISALTNTTATGIFSGIVYNSQSPADSIVITNGKFYVPLKQ